MVDRNTSHTPGEGDMPFFGAPESPPSLSARFINEKLSQFNGLLARAMELDENLQSGPEITKRFVVSSGGNDKYPFPHRRIKLRPKSRVESVLAVVALRFPSEGLTGLNNHPDGDQVYLGWESVVGDEAYFVLDAIAFSRLELHIAFRDADDMGGWPSLASRTSTDELDSFHLEQVQKDFEPDLQPIGVEVKV